MRHNDMLIPTLLIEAIAKRAVATGDVPDAYLHALMKYFVISKKSPANHLSLYLKHIISIRNLVLMKMERKLYIKD